MTSKEFLRGLGNLHARYILEAEAYQVPKIRPWIKWAALAACLAIVVAAAWKLLPRPTPATVPDGVSTDTTTLPGGDSTEAADQNGDLYDSVEANKAAPAEILVTETIGGLKLGMTEQEIEAILGTGYTVSNSGVVEVTEDYRVINWFYPEAILGLADTGEGWFLNEIQLLSDSTLTLSTGIGIGSTEAETTAAYPEAEVTEETPGSGRKILQMGAFENGLWISLEDGKVDSIFLGCLAPYPQEAVLEEPLFASLAADTLTVQRADGSTVELVDRAAKKVSTVLTISEPEPADRPKEAPAWWLDFGNGTYLAVYGHDDLATVYTGDSLDTTLETMADHGTGIYLDLDATLTGAMENPKETWE